MDLKQLKKLADENGLDYQRNANTEQMKALLDAAEINYSEEVKFEEKPVKENFTNLDFELEEVKKEYKAAQTEIDIKKADQKRFVLKEKLKADRNRFKRFLEWERSRNLISVKDDYLLNELQAEDISNLCTCYRSPSAGSFAEVGKEYKYSSYYDESRNKEMYVVYVERFIAPEDQITPQLAWKMSQGFMPQESDYLPGKTQYRRTVLVESEFFKYFKVDEI